VNWAVVLADFFEIASSLPFVEERCARCFHRNSGTISESQSGNSSGRPKQDQPIVAHRRTGKVDPALRPFYRFNFLTRE
jgi:hypothetical protein